MAIEEKKLVKISVIQMNSVSDKAANLAKAERLTRSAVTQDSPDMIVFPEHFDWAGGSTQEKVAAGEPEADGPAYRFCARMAAEYGIYVHSGSFYEKVPGQERVFNTTVVFDPHGKELGRYRKIHMFDIFTPDGLRYGESDAVAAGSEVCTADVGDFRLGLAICYDLRFPELFQQLVDRGANVIMLPAAFTLQTGKDHWEVLCRARAIETQSYVVACGSHGPFRQNGETRYTYGHSLIVDPWGHVIAKCSDGDGFATARLDIQLIDKVRKEIPLAKQKVLQ
nr:carbon-nitrogen hydrolase family protein [Parapusillimonas granuli]